MNEPAALPVIPAPSTPAEEVINRAFAALSAADLAVPLPEEMGDSFQREYLSAIARRVLVPRPDGKRWIAVRPDPSCGQCRGSLAYRYKRAPKKEGEAPMVSACECVYRRIRRWEETRQVAPAGTPITASPTIRPAAPPRTDALSQQIAEVEVRLAAADARKAEALAPIEEAIAEQVKLFAGAEQAIVELGDAQEEARIEASALRRRAEVLRAQAAALDEQAARVDESLAGHIAKVARVKVDQESIGQRGLELLTVKAKIEARHAERTAGDRRRMERLREKLGRRS